MSTKRKIKNRNLKTKTSRKNTRKNSKNMNRKFDMHMGSRGDFANLSDDELLDDELYWLAAHIETTFAVLNETDIWHPLAWRNGKHIPLSVGLVTVSSSRHLEPFFQQVASPFMPYVKNSPEDTPPRMIPSQVFYNCFGCTVVSGSQIVIQDVLGRVENKLRGSETPKEASAIFSKIIKEAWAETTTNQLYKIRAMLRGHIHHVCSFCPEFKKVPDEYKAFIALETAVKVPEAFTPIPQMNLNGLMEMAYDCSFSSGSLHGVELLKSLKEAGVETPEITDPFPQ